jgi:hypothetical protein
MIYTGPLPDFMSDSARTFQDGIHTMKLHQCPLTDDEKNRMIAQAAYYRYEKRGRTNGDSVEDWLTAEAEVEKHLRDSCQLKLQTQVLAAYQKTRSEVRKIFALSQEKANADRIRPSFDRLARKLQELGEFVPGTFENVGKRTRRGIDVTGAKWGHRWEDFRVKRTQFLHDTSKNFKTWVNRQRGKDE